jgi:hypothetical protein
MKIIAWWSAGVTSAVACKLAFDKYSIDNVRAVYIHIDTAHPDNERFKKDCEDWYGKKIETIKSLKYTDQFDAIKRGTRSYVNGPRGAPCTTYLKKDVRVHFEKENEFTNQVFGFEYSKSEINRAIRFVEQHPNTRPLFPLIEEKLTKKSCLKILLKEGIEIPKMYQLGFNNNNCVGCVKGGMGYWNLIRELFPETFDKMSELEKSKGHSCIKGVFLKDLKPGTGRLPKIDIPDCSLFCDLEFTDVLDEKTEQILNNKLKISEITDAN